MQMWANIFVNRMGNQMGKIKMIEYSTGAGAGKRTLSTFQHFQILFIGENVILVGI